MSAKSQHGVLPRNPDAQVEAPVISAHARPAQLRAGDQPAGRGNGQADGRVDGRGDGQAGSRNAWRAGLILLSSVALGGLALAIWNRKGIDSMHRSRAEDLRPDGDARDAREID